MTPGFHFSTAALRGGFLVVLGLFVLLPAASAQRQVTGTVTDIDSGEPLIGATILVAGTNSGSVTDVDGRFTLQLPAEANELLVTYVGYRPREVEVGNRSTLSIQLAPNANALDEIVVIGYGEVNRRDLTGAVGQVDSDKINELPVAGFDQALQGKVSGVRVLNTNAAPGGGVDIQIRGVGSLTGGGFPLVVVDGLPLSDENLSAEGNPFNLINPSDIESIEVLKDASSAAIYGARAANGVILITTKRGKSGQSRINFNASYGVDEIINQVAVGDRASYLQHYYDQRHQAYYNSDPGNYNPDLDASFKFGIDSDEDFRERIRNTELYNLLGGNAARGLSFLSYDTVNTTPTPRLIQQVEGLVDGTADILSNDQDWINAITRGGTFPGSTATYNLSASGGSDRVRYLISGGYFDQQGIVPSTDFERITANVNVDFAVNDFITVGAKVTPSWQDLNNIGGNRVEGRWFLSPLYQTALILPPTLPAYGEDGEPVDYGIQSPHWRQDNGWGTTFFGNPVYQFRRLDNRKTFRALSNFWGEVSPLPGLKFRSAILLDFANRRNRQFTPSTFGGRFGSPGDQNLVNVSASDLIGRTTKWYWENILSYDVTLNEAHSLNAVVGFTSEKTRDGFVFLRKENFASDDVDFPAAGAIIENPLTDATDGEIQYAFIGMLARLQYNYRGRYYLTGSIRRDGSSRFGRETLWGNFPSVALAWRISEEPFLGSPAWMDNLKIRASYGETGNSSIPNFRQQRIIDINAYSLGGGFAQGLFDARLFDSGLGWERTREVNIGADVGVFNNRLRLSADWYNRESTDILLSVDLPVYSGFNSILQNFGEMVNRGFEVTLGGTPVVGKVSWDIDANVSHNRNRITRLFPNENQFISGQAAGSITYSRSYTDGPLGVFWGGVYDGVFRSYDEIYSQPSVFQYSTNLNTMAFRSSQPGDMRTRDVNGDGVLDGNDKTVIGNPWPDAYWGINSTVRFANFDFFIQLDGTVGAEVYNAVRYEWFRQAHRGFNMPQEYLDDYWTPDNPDAFWPATAAFLQRNAGWDNSVIVEDGDFTAIRTIRLGYTLPANLTANNFLQNVRFYLNVQNAAYFTNYRGFNPESSNLGASDISRVRNFGVDAGNYPLSRTFSFGLDLTL